MTKAKFTILGSKELAPADGNSEYLGTVYDIQLDDADGVMVQYRVSGINEAHGIIWTIRDFGVNGYNTEFNSRLGKKIINACTSNSIFIQSDDSGSRRFSEQNFS